MYIKKGRRFDYSEKMGVWEISRKVRKDLVHVLRSFTPCCPKVQNRRWPVADYLVELSLWSNFLHWSSSSGHPRFFQYSLISIEVWTEYRKPNRNYFSSFLPFYIRLIFFFFFPFLWYPLFKKINKLDNLLLKTFYLFCQQNFFFFCWF